MGHKEVQKCNGSNRTRLPVAEILLNFNPANAVNSGFWMLESLALARLFILAQA
jgi:hypothetical protein